mgnify:CR=1 FL=1
MPLESIGTSPMNSDNIVENNSQATPLGRTINSEEVLCMNDNIFIIDNSPQHTPAISSPLELTPTERILLMICLGSVW